jgi:hypothetical protein
MGGIKINQISLNNMKLDQQFLVREGNAPGDVKANAGERTGVDTPFITINSYPVSEYMNSFKMDLTGFLPVIDFSFYAGNPTFISTNYPKDGDVVSVYISSPEGYYKPIRMDFNILNVRSSVSSKYSDSGSASDPDGSQFRFSITAECRIPSLYTPLIKSFREKNSQQTLLEVSQDLNLGFSTNEDSTEDVMTWICPNYSYYDFIQEVCLRSYKDDDSSFFDCWIDPYYNLNFVNLGTQFGYDGIVKEEVVFATGYSSNKNYKPNVLIDGSPPVNIRRTYLLLRNLLDKDVYPFGINGYTLISNAGTNVNKTGYIVNIGFYDENLDDPDPANKYINYDIESITGKEIVSGQILQKGRGNDDEYKKEKRREWLGMLNRKDDTGGVHLNYFHAKYQNLINYNDCTKFSLKVELDGYFPGIYRGQVVPVQIEVGKINLRSENTGNSSPGTKNTSTGYKTDNFLSGNYVVMGIEIYWSNSGFKQILYLSKRDWVVNRAGNLPKAYPFVLE